MDTESPTSTPTGSEPKRRNLAVGAALGIIGLTASIMGVSAIAGANDDPISEPAVDETFDGDAEDENLDWDEDLDWIEDDSAWIPFDECIDEQLGDIDEPAGDTDLSDEDWDALEAQFEAAEAQCEDLLPEDVQAEIAAWEPFEQCIDEQLGDIDQNIDEESLTDADWEALDAQFEAAETACFDLLPEDVQIEWQAFEAFDQCLTDAGFGPDELFESGTVVHVDTGEGAQIIEFGDTVGTVTITGDANGVSISTEGGVSVVDEAEIDAAFEACEQLLPEDLMDDDVDDEFDMDDDDMDDDDLDDEFDTDDDA